MTPAADQAAVSERPLDEDPAAESPNKVSRRARIVLMTILVVGLVVVGSVAMAFSHWSGSEPQPFTEVAYGERLYGYLERTLETVSTAGTEARRTGGYDGCTMESGEEGEQRTLVVYLPLGEEQGGAEALAEVGRLWQSETFGYPFEVADVVVGESSVSAIADGFSMEAVADGTELEATAVSDCIPIGLVEPVDNG